MSAFFHDMGMTLADVEDKDKQRTNHHFYAEIPIKEFFERNIEKIPENHVLLVECLKRPGVENMAFRTNPFLLATNSPRRSIPYYIREHLNACCQRESNSNNYRFY